MASMQELQEQIPVTLLEISTFSYSLTNQKLVQTFVIQLIYPGSRV